MKKALVVLLSLVIILPLVSCSEVSVDTVIVAASARDYRGENYQDVVNQLSSTGFVNIRTEPVEDLVMGWLTKDGEVEEITIDGNSTFSKGDKFDKDVEVLIAYHTFPHEDEALSNDSSESQNEAEDPSANAITENYRTETEKWLASDEYADCLKKGKFPAVPGNNPYGSGINDSDRNQDIYYLNSSMKGPWGKETEYDEYEYYIPGGKYLVMNASNPKGYAGVPTGCNVYIGNPESEEEWETYSFTEYGEIQEIVIPDGYYVSLTISAIVTFEPLTE